MDAVDILMVLGKVGKVPTELKCLAVSHVMRGETRYVPSVPENRLHSVINACWNSGCDTVDMCLDSIPVACLAHCLPSLVCLSLPFGWPYSSIKYFHQGILGVDSAILVSLAETNNAAANARIFRLYPSINCRL